MASYTINQYQYFEFIYADATNGLYINNQPDNIGFYDNGADYTFEVDVFPVAGVYVFDVYDSGNNPYDTITLTVNAVVPNITHNLNLSDALPPQILPPAPISSWITTGNYVPEWLNISFGQYNITSVNKVGTFYVLLEDVADPLNNVYLIEFIFDTGLVEYDYCTPYDITIVWLNTSGGWSSYCFKGRKTFGVNVGSKNIYKSSKNIQRYYSVENVYDNILVLSGEIPIAHSDFVKSLKYSVQAYIFRSTFIPILIEDTDFTLYTEGDGLMVYDIKVKYGQEILVQTQ